MSGTDYVTTPNLGLFKPIYDMDDGTWGAHLNSNADVLDAALAIGSGGLFLPLAGGTVNGQLAVASHLTGTTTASTASINMTAVGSGANGPATGQFGLSIDAAKDNWFTGTATAGEIDALVVTARQGGPNGDCGGVLVNVATTGNSYSAVLETVNQQQAVNTGTVSYGIRTQEATNDMVSGFRYGKILTADYGNLTSAILTQNVSGQSTWGAVLQNFKNGTSNFIIDDNGNVTAAAATAGFLNLRATGSLYLRSDTYAAIAWDGTNGAVQFNIGGNACEINQGGFITLFGSQVLRYRVTGWGAPAGGSRAAFNAASATLPQTAAAVAQLIADLTTHGMIGP